MSQQELEESKTNFAEYLPVPIPLTAQAWPKGTKPLVSICCITYNHQRFIAQAIEGFLMQETTFPVEILINDDASTDDTASIVRDYQARFPGLIRSFIWVENQYSKGEISLHKLFLAASGEFLAICEGDDYWISKHKIQKQIEFLEKHDDVGLCIHDAFRETIGHEEGPVPREPFFHWYPDRALTFADFVGGFAPHTASCVFRNRQDILYPIIERKMRFAMTIFFALLADGSAAACLPDKMSVYRVHPGGIYSCRPPEEQLIMDNICQWRSRNYFRTKEHRRIFSLKLIENYIALLSIYLKKKDCSHSLFAAIRILELLFVPPCPRALRVNAFRLWSYWRKKILKPIR